MTPRVTVLLPAYNAEDHLAGAVRSVLEQTLTDWELVIVNDGSTDDTRAVALGFKDRRIRLVDAPRNLGISGALNLGLEQARADLVARLDADDRCRPDRLRFQAEQMESEPEVGFSFVRCSIQTDQGETLLSLAADSWDRRWLQLFTNGFGNHSGAMFRLRAVRELGGYDPELNDAEDYDLWCRLIQGGWGCRYHDEVLVHRQQHARSLSATRASGLDRAAARVSARELTRLVPELTDREARRLRRLYLQPRELGEGSSLGLLRSVGRLLRSLERHGWGDPSWRRRIAWELLLRVRITGRERMSRGEYGWLGAIAAARLIQHWLQLRSPGESLDPQGRDVA